MLYTVYLMLIATAFTVMPYSMLIYASKIKYLATMSYMAFFLVLLALLSAKFSLVQISYSGLSVMIL